MRVAENNDNQNILNTIIPKYKTIYDFDGLKSDINFDPLQFYIDSLPLTTEQRNYMQTIAEIIENNNFDNAIAELTELEANITLDSIQAAPILISISIGKYSLSYWKVNYQEWYNLNHTLKSNLSILEVPTIVKADVGGGLVGALIGAGTSGNVVSGAIVGAVGGSLLQGLSEVW